MRWKLTSYEKNCTLFLLEMNRMLWGIEHFKHYLRGRHFLLFTNHQLLTGLCKVHKRTDQRLAEAMNQYDFKMIYKKGRRCQLTISPATSSLPSTGPTMRWPTCKKMNEKLGPSQQRTASDRSLEDIIL